MHRMLSRAEVTTNFNSLTSITGGGGSFRGQRCLYGVEKAQLLPSCAFEISEKLVRDADLYNMSSSWLELVSVEGDG